MKFRIHIISDTHFNHKRIITYENRPFDSVEEMNQTMINRWNEVVSDEDLVIHLGDFVFGGIHKIRAIHSQLNGNMIIIKGNHDKWYRMNAVGINMYENLKIGHLFLTHEPTRVDDGLVNVHGHIHDKKSWFGINASVERTNYYPRLIEHYFKEAKKILKRRGWNEGNIEEGGYRTAKNKGGKNKTRDISKRL